MGEVAVLQPQNLFNNHDRTAANRHPCNRIMKSGPVVSRSTNRRKVSPPAVPKEKNTTPTVPAAAPLRERNTNNHHRNTTKAATNDLVMGQVKILKRGEILPTTTTTSPAAGILKEVKKGQGEDLVVLSSADGVGPKNMGISDLYAGSAFITSPEPSSLPVPVFFKKKDAVFVTDQDATSDLRKLLRLDLS